MKKHTKRDAPNPERGGARALGLSQSQLVTIASEFLFDPIRQRIVEQRGRPVLQHVREYAHHLRAKGNKDKHNLGTIRMARVMLHLCRVQTWSAASPTRAQVQAAMQKLRTIRSGRLGPATVNHYFQSLKGFANWMIADYRAERSPCLGIRPYSTESDTRRPRRRLSHEELLRLVEAANAGRVIAGIPGFERAMSYLQAATTGLRSAELQSLTDESYRLSDKPTVTITAAYAKNGRKETIEIRQDMAAMLREYFVAIGRKTHVFRRPPGNAMRALRADLSAAAIPYRTADGYADFHALRHTFISDLFDHGATQPQAQKLARHRTAAMTARYAHSSEEGRRSVIERMPAPPTIRLNSQSVRTDAAPSLTQPGRMDQHERTK